MYEAYCDRNNSLDDFWWVTDKYTGERKKCKKIKKFSPKNEIIIIVFVHDFSDDTS